MFGTKLFLLEVQINSVGGKMDAMSCGNVILYESLSLNILLTDVLSINTQMIVLTLLI